MDIKGFVMDHMGHFAVNDLPNKVFALLVAALLGHALGRWGARLAPRMARETAVWAALAALAISFVRTQLPLAVALLALVLLVRAGQEQGPPRLVVLGAVVLGMGCGGGAALATLLLAIPFILLLRWAHVGGQS